MLRVYDMLAIIPFLFDVLWFVAWYVGVPMGLAYLGGLLFRQDLEEPEAPEDASSRMWNPRTTQREGLPRPRCYGRNMHHGNIAAKWTDVDGDEREILYLLVEHGDGPTKGNIAGEIYLNDQPANNFGSVVVQERKGTMDQTCMTGFEKQKLEYSSNCELKYADAEHIWTTPNSFFDDIEYTICFPNGLIKYHKDGDKTTGLAKLKVRIREHPSGGWTTLFDEYIGACQTKPLFKKYLVSEQSFNCVRGKQYDLGFKRTTQESGERHVDNSYLRSLREVVDVAFERPGKALTGIKAIATAQLSGSIDVKIIREDRLVNTFNGTTWEIKYSRCRSDVAFDLVTQPVISGNGNSLPWKIERYEGTDPSNVDIEFFYNWASFCSDQVLDGFGGTEDRLACDIKVDFQTDVWSLVNKIAQVGRAYLYWAGHTLTGWIDKAVSEPTDLVTMDTIMARTWRNRWVGKDELAGVVEVFFQDKRLGYERTHVPFPKAAAGAYTRIISIEGTGITSYGTAVHMANHALTRNALIRNVNAFRQFRDGFRHKLGEVIRLQHKVPDWGQGYRVISCPSSSTIKLDRVVTGVNANDLLYVRSYDEVGEVVDNSVYTVVSTSGSIVTIAETWDPTPVKNNIAAIGVSGAIVLRRITKIEPTVDNYFDIEVETYDVALYDADDLDPDAPNKDYIWSAPPGAITKPVTPDQVVELIDRLLPPQPDIEQPWPSNLKWNDNTPSSGYISWSKDDADEPITFRLKGTTYEITPDNTNDEFIYWDPNYTTTFRTTNLISVATAKGNWLMCRNIDGIAYPAQGMMLAQIGILLAGFLRVGTADIEDLAVTTAKIKDLAVTTAKIKDLAVETLKIKNEAVTVPAAVSGSSLDFTTTGAPLFINASGLIYLYHTVGDGWERWRYRLKIKRNGTLIYDTGEMTQYTYLNLTKKHIPWSTGIINQPSAGSYTFTINFTKSEDAGDLDFLNPNIFIIETKK